FQRTLRQELSTLETTADVEEALFRAAPGARALVAAMEAEIAALGSGADDTELDLPISLYGGG
ncbi:MAG: hypothetical protein JHD05_02675, partial [Thermoleophilia bacterium]|nr:hypothetical protein [Thermoleophilia bacterium]